VRSPWDGWAGWPLFPERQQAFPVGDVDFLNPHAFMVYVLNKARFSPGLEGK
jgi:hypothetical protein